MYEQDGKKEAMDDKKEAKDEKAGVKKKADDKKEAKRSNLAAMLRGMTTTDVNGESHLANWVVLGGVVSSVGVAFSVGYYVANRKEQDTEALAPLLNVV